MRIIILVASAYLLASSLFAKASNQSPHQIVSEMQVEMVELYLPLCSSGTMAKYFYLNLSFSDLIEASSSSETPQADATRWFLSVYDCKPRLFSLPKSLLRVCTKLVKNGNCDALPVWLDGELWHTFIPDRE